MSANLEKSAVATGLAMASFHCNPKERQKNVRTTAQLHSFHMIEKVMLKILQVSLP